MMLVAHSVTILQESTSLSASSIAFRGPKYIFKTHYFLRAAAILALVVLGVLYALLPFRISIGPSWLLLPFEGVLVLPLVIAFLIRRRVSPATFRTGSRVLLGIVTFCFAVGIANLMFNLPGQKGVVLIYSGLLLYGFNILMFALWYWEIDGGGPEQRRTSDRQAADFLFPQQMGGLDENWAPQFFDYLYIAFTGATAFSPTDTMPLSHRAKFLMMMEAVFALILIGFVVSRAINII
jgi:hypothetical protein